jgi:hypothetical protein
VESRIEYGAKSRFFGGIEISNSNSPPDHARGTFTRTDLSDTFIIRRKLMQGRMMPEVQVA